MNNKLTLKLFVVLFGLAIVANDLLAIRPYRYENSEYEFYQDDEGDYYGDYDDDYYQDDDGGSATRGLLGGAATGALIGGIAGGGRGAGIGAGVGAGLGLVSGSAADRNRRERARMNRDDRAAQRGSNRRMSEERRSTEAQLPEQVYY